ncbi:MAG TPA: hypothetical protein VKU39_14955 [Streptosporangiaceae bacterium]|nr:hypothetical protein [Streptosporangiaceae bacterium]
MTHDKINEAARKRMTQTGEPYAAARRAVIREHRSGPEAAGRWFELKYRRAGLDRVGALLDTVLGGGPGLSGTTVTGHEIQVRVPGFTLDIPLTAVRSADRSGRNLHGTTGVHGGKGKWLVNGAPDGLVDLTISPPCYTGRSLATLFQRAAVTKLTVSLVDADGFIAACTGQLSAAAEQ